MKFNISRKQQLTEVSDGAGNSVPLPHCGSFSYKETQAIEKLIDSGVSENYRAEYVAAILKERLRKEDPTILDKTTESLLADENGEPIPNTLLNAMFNFFDSERREWQPDTQRLQLRGKDAVTIARKYAEENKLAVVQRSDMVDSEIVFVVDNIEKLETESQLHNLMKEQSVKAAIESGDYDISKIVELNRQYYVWDILANHLEELPAKKPKAKALIGTEISGS